jgi:hypothetical protein
MAYDRYEVEHHLTPAGWVTGTVTDSGNQETIVEPPTDRVETWLYKMEQSSGWSRESRHWELAWKHPSMSLEERRALRASFTPPGREFPSLGPMQALLNDGR